MTKACLDTAGPKELNFPEERKRALYDVFASGDPRFDGKLFVGVSSTGIYCRTVCTAKMPRYENCTFFRTAAEAEAAGYRPCMTCRPEVAPGVSAVDARASLARRAASVIRAQCAVPGGVEAIAAKLGYTGRHLRRAFASEYGVTPSQYAQTCRLLLAKSLLTDSDLPVALVAEASGFGSARRFNDVFMERYRLTPTDLRKRAGNGAAPSGTITVHLGYRPPYRFLELLSFFRERQMEEVELVNETEYARTVHMEEPGGNVACGWLRIENDSKRNRLVVTMSESLAPCVPQVVARVRSMFDVDCDPQAIARGLASLDDIVPGAVREGTRLPGCFDPFETSCRAVLGQQVSITAANKLAARIVKRYGAPVETGVDGLTRAFPTPADMIALERIEGVFGELGVLRTRSRAIAQIARMLETGALDFGPGALAAKQIETLLSIKGIGPWTANYIAMRALSYPDAFLEDDTGVAHALPNMTPKRRLKAAEGWRPWRSYAVVSLWNSLADSDENA